MIIDCRILFPVGRSCATYLHVGLAVLFGKQWVQGEDDISGGASRPHDLSFLPQLAHPPACTVAKPSSTLCNVWRTPTCPASNIKSSMFREPSNDCLLVGGGEVRLRRLGILVASGWPTARGSRRKLSSLTGCVWRSDERAGRLRNLVYFCIIFLGCLYYSLSLFWFIIRFKFPRSLPYLPYGSTLKTHSSQSEIFIKIPFSLIPFLHSHKNAGISRRLFPHLRWWTHLQEFYGFRVLLFLCLRPWHR